VTLLKLPRDALGESSWNRNRKYIKAPYKNPHVIEKIIEKEGKKWKKNESVEDGEMRRRKDERKGWKTSGARGKREMRRRGNWRKKTTSFK
jgi:hypothetical protein